MEILIKFLKIRWSRVKDRKGITNTYILDKDINFMNINLIMKYYN